MMYYAQSIVEPPNAYMTLHCTPQWYTAIYAVGVVKTRALCEALCDNATLVSID